MSDKDNNEGEHGTPVADKVPETPEPAPTPEHTPPPVTEPHHDDSLKETVARLEAAMNTLSDQVAGLTEPKDPDTSPVKEPWFRRRVGRS